MRLRKDGEEDAEKSGDQTQEAKQEEETQPDTHEAQSKDVQARWFGGDQGSSRCDSKCAILRLKLFRVVFVPTALARVSRLVRPWHPEKTERLQ